ncbi:MAG: DUF885 family protein [Fimbriimonadaceae bacterium]|nr:DUF885 family protein [Fimbriimonadaceae bacterium]
MIGAVSALFALALVAPAQNPMIAFIERFSSDYADLTRFYSLDLSMARRDRLERFLTESERRLAEVREADLPFDGRIDRRLMANHLSTLRSALALKARKLSETARATPFRDRILNLEEARWRVEPLDPKLAADELDGIRKEVGEVRAELQAGIDGKPDGLKLDRVVANRARQEVESLRRTLETWFKHYDGYKPVFGWWTRAPYKQADESLRDFAKYLKESVLGIKEGDEEPLIGSPIGREALVDDMRHEMLPWSPEDLLKIAEREFAWCEAEWKRAARDMGLGDDRRAALERVKADYVPPGEQDDLAAALAREAIQFLKERDLVTIDPLCEETWRVDMIPEKDQKLWPFQFYGGQRVAVSYPLDTMDHETKMMSLRGNNRHFTRCTIQHELIPGHHLQGFMAKRFRPYRDVFSTPFFIEGWALHWEMLLWDLGFPQTPEDRIGFLFWRTHRCARIIVSLKYHLGEMTPEQMIAFLVERVGHERWTATSEVRRYIGDMYSPLYQAAYMIGGLQLRELHTELVGAGKMTNRAFHDAVLREGSIPMAMLGAALRGRMPSSD